MSYRILKVEVEALRDPEDMAAEDHSVAGEYEVEVNVGLDDETTAGVALDILHTTFPIDNLDDFEITVMHGDEPIYPDDSSSYVGEDMGGSAWKI